MNLEWGLYELCISYIVWKEKDREIWGRGIEGRREETEIKMQNNLHMSKKNSNFAAQNQNNEWMSEMELEAKISQGLKITHRKLVEQHRRDNQPLIFSENGVVKQVDPFTVAI